MTAWFSSANWSVTCCLTEECVEPVLGYVTEDHIVVSDRMLISMSVEILEMLCCKTANSLASQAGDLNPDNLLSPLHLMCIFKKLNLS